LRHQSPKHNVARIDDGESRFRVKGSDCLPCENTRSTAVDVAKTTLTHGQAVNLKKQTWDTKVIQCHGREPRIDRPVIPPPCNGVLDLFDGLREVLIKLVGFLNTLHWDIKEVCHVFILGLGLHEVSKI
jgi:hypothetical protein